MKIPASVTRAVGRSFLILRKQSPNILFATGVVGTVASTVLACKATLKLEDTLDTIKSDIQGAKELKEKTAVQAYSIEQDWSRDAVYIYARAGLQITKLYAPAVIVGGLSIACLTGSHIQLMRRNSALMAAYALMQKAYEDYRNRVRELVGEEKELELYHAIKEEVVGKEIVKSADPNQWSPYARFFDETSQYWRKDPEMNRLYIQCQQNYANNLLRARGHVFLNEVYDMLGLERSQAGAVVGWVIGKEGDNYVSFGIFEQRNANFIAGWERTILLDFNVDGVIYDKI